MAEPRAGRPRATGPRPVLPRRVYVVRRLVALAVVVALVVVAVLVVRRLTGSDDAAPATPTATAHTPKTPASTAADEPTLSAVEEAALAAGVPVCTADHLDVEFDATKDAYAGTEKPAFRITYTNTGDEPCLADAGDAMRRVTVVSGDDTVWASWHCRREPESRPLLLGPDEPSEETYRWPRVRSDKACSAGQPAPRAGTYTARLLIGEDVAAKAVFELR
ncbi:hypothetical protein [Cellulomonas palmilytica]|uniref:hypothetical protein n=1 Tax=Cellulomonas palmilytica TaxID=2608402 RepID=UPI001F3B4BC8|nr:hypothetical protein [Cellulomonas palmilytica]UJP40852.1 hypothetical protein F1D97_05055 [Cellulomonas palmilytica]